MRYLTLTRLLIGSLLVLGCLRPAMAECPNVIYIAVAQSGDVQVNGNSVVTEGIDAELAKLKPSAQLVVYYRENARTDPTPQEWAKIKAVLDSVMKLRLPISLSSKPDFSDAIDGDGNSHPRATCGK
jgi:hypothetical protein